MNEAVGSGTLSVKALFKVNQVAKDEFGNTYITAYATQGKKLGDRELQDFAEATPQGEFKITIAKSRAAADFFVPGDEVYFFITKRQPVAAQ